MSVEEPRPPWVQYPGEEPTWGGWRQGTSEGWLLHTWLPFWRSLDDERRAVYLRRWPPPSEDWRRYVTTLWR